MSDTVQVRKLGPSDRGTLLKMYAGFSPLGVAQGLPPRGEEARRDWIDHALAEEINIGAFSPAGELAGHSFLAPSGPGESELAVFVHQEFRQRGIGSALVKAALHKGEQTGLRRIWAQTSSDNLAALRLLKRCGFRSAKFTFPVVEMELELPAPVASQSPT